jgi:hypothetical protein
MNWKEQKRRRQQYYHGYRRARLSPITKTFFDLLTILFVIAMLISAGAWLANLFTR